MSRARRLFGLAQLLESRSGMALEEIARHFTVSERTVFRDLAALEEQGMPVEHLEGRRYRIESSRPGPATLDSTDLALVRVALADLPQRDTDPLARRFARMIQKVESALRGRAPASHRTSAEIDRDRRELERLIAERRPATFRYRPLGGGAETVRRVDPWQIFERGGAGYLVGRCHLHDEPRLFRLERVRAVEVGPGRFAPPAATDVERFLAGARARLGVAPAASGVEFALRLSPAAARALPAASTLPDERRTPQPDGGLELRGRARDLEQAARFALELGDGVTALEPPELRIRVRRLASAALRRNP